MRTCERVVFDVYYILDIWPGMLWYWMRQTPLWSRKCKSFVCELDFSALPFWDCPALCVLLSCEAVAIKARHWQVLGTCLVVQPLNHQMLPFGKLTELWKITTVIGKSTIIWPFSIAMFVCQRVWLYHQRPKSRKWFKNTLSNHYFYHSF